MAATWVDTAPLTSYSRLWNRRTPLNKHSPPPIKFQHQNFNSFLHQTRHCGRFSFFFSKINKRTPMFIPESRVVIFSLFWRFGKNEKSLWDLATFMYWTSMQILWTEVCVPFLLNLRVSKRKSINRSFSRAQRRTMGSKCVCNRIWNNVSTILWLVHWKSFNGVNDLWNLMKKHKCVQVLL